MDALEEFHPARIADRILGMGDIVSPRREGGARRSTRRRPPSIAEKMRKGEFDLDDLPTSSAQMEKLGGMGGMMGMLPGIGKMKEQLDAANLDDKIVQAPARHHLRR